MSLLFIFLFLLSYMKYTSSVSRMYSYNSNNLGLIIRNKALKLLLSLDYKKYKNQFLMIQHKRDTIYNTCFLNYCVCYCTYESLSEEDKTIIETIISMSL